MKLYFVAITIFTLLYLSKITYNYIKTNNISINMFSDIIQSQTTKECIQIYRNECKNSNLAKSSMMIVIKNNTIIHISKNSNTWTQRYNGYKKLIERTLDHHNIKDCTLKIALGDEPVKGYFNFCRNKNASGYFLIPNFRFMLDNVVKGTYYKREEETLDWDDTLDYIYSNDTTPFDNKYEKMLFVGGDQHIQRKKYFDLLYKNHSVDSIYDGYHWKARENNRLNKIEKAGKTFISFDKHFNYKYPIYIDGFTNSDRFRLLMTLNCVPFYCKTKYEEFYTHLLKPNKNYIEFSDVSELKDIYDMCNKNTELCNDIRYNNKKFIANILTTKNIYKYISDLLNKLN